MLCPSCRSKSAVFDSRAFDRTTRRGRKCLDEELEAAIFEDGFQFDEDEL